MIFETLIIVSIVLLVLLLVILIILMFLGRRKKKKLNFSDLFEIEPNQYKLAIEQINKLDQKYRDVIEKHGAKIAVFTTTNVEFESLGLSPESMFKRISRTEDVMSTDFLGVIHYGVWWTNIDVGEAHRVLKRNRPDLFEL